MRSALDPPPGLVSDETTNSTPGLWADGDKVRFWRGRPQVIGGWAKAYASAITGVCRGALRWQDLNTYTNTALGTSSNLYVLKESTLYDITPASFVDGNVSTVARWGYGARGYGTGPYGGGPLMETWPRTWSLGTYGENLIANYRGGPIYRWQNDTTAVAEPLTGAPDHANFILMTDKRQMLAFGTHEVVSDEFNPMCIRGSDIEDIETWSPTSTNNSFELVVQGGSRFVAAAMMGEYVIAWTDTSVFLGQFQVDNTLDPWRFDLIASNCGLAGPNAFCVTETGAFWLTPAWQFMSYQTGGIPSAVDCPITTDFRDNLDTAQVDKVIATHVPRYQEVWFIYPDTRDGDECSRFVAMSLAGQGWFRGTLARTAAVQLISENPIWVSDDGYIYTHESGTDADGAALDWFVTTSAQYLGEGETVAMIRDIRPDFEDQENSVNLTFSTQDYPQATPRDAGTWALAVGREKRDLRVSGRIVTQKFAGTNYVRFGKPSYDIRPGGRR